MSIVYTLCGLYIFAGSEQKNANSQVGGVYAHAKSANPNMTGRKSIIQPGDILLYRKLHNGHTESIRFLERLENGAQALEYYHVALAFDSQSKIEANGKKVTIDPIDFGSFDVFRPPIPLQQRNIAIQHMKDLVGEPYDWWLVADDILRCVTRNVIHLPVSFVQIEEQHKKICTSLVVQYFTAAKWGPTFHLNVSPEDIYFSVRDYRISTDGYSTTFSS